MCVGVEYLVINALFTTLLIHVQQDIDYTIYCGFLTILIIIIFIRHWSVIGYLIFVAVFLVIVFLVVVCRSAVGLVM